MSGWDPRTGQTIAGDDLTDLIKAAGATATPPFSPDTCNALCIKLMNGGGDEALQQFYTLDVHEAQSRICSFFQSVQNPAMHVKIEFGHLAAIAFRDAQHRVQTSWMDKSVMTTAPAMVYYTTTDFPEWAHKITSCFLNVIKIREGINRIKDTASRRTTTSSEVNTTPPTSSMFYQGVLCQPPSLQGFMYA